MDFSAARARLIEDLRLEISEERVLSAMNRVPRELFVSEKYRHMAYHDTPLPIGLGQTVSQPFIIALMTEALELSSNDKVLEIGTGSGYQSAILAELARWVVTIERLEDLSTRAKSVLDSLGYKNIEFHLAEKNLGWMVGAPYEAIIVTAAAPRISQQLVDQLEIGGRLVTPVGSLYEQDLIKVIKQKGKNVTKNLGACRFVPLIGDGAWEGEY